MPRPSDTGESGVFLDDYPRIQRRPDPAGDPENERPPRRPSMRRVPRLPWRRVGIVAGVAAAGVLLGWCLHPSGDDAVVAARAAQATAEARAEQLDGDLATATAALATERATAAKIIADRAKDVADAEAATKAVADKLAAAAGSHGEVAIAGAEVRLVIPEKVLFKPGEVELTAAGLEVLSSIGTALADDELAARLVRVEGHTDDGPLPRPKPAPRGGKKPAAPAAFASRWEVGSARAIAVVRYLVDQVRIDARRVAAATYAEHRPIGKAKAKNRRIELVVVPAP
jgi:flagellar motor protein MotB